MSETKFTAQLAAKVLAFGAADDARPDAHCLTLQVGKDEVRLPVPQEFVLSIARAGLLFCDVSLRLELAAPEGVEGQSPAPLQPPTLLELIEAAERALSPALEQAEAEARACDVFDTAQQLELRAAKEAISSAKEAEVALLDKVETEETLMEELKGGLR